LLLILVFLLLVDEFLKAMKKISKSIVVGQLNTYRIEQNHSLVHYLKELCHEAKVLAELPDQMVYLWLLYFNNERVRKLDVLRRNDEIVCLRYEHLDEVEAVAEVVLASIQRLFLHNLIYNRLIEAASDLRSGHTVAHFLLVECLARARRLFLLLDDEFWLTTEGALTLDAAAKFFVEQRVLANVL